MSPLGFFTAITITGLMFYFIIKVYVAVFFNGFYGFKLYLKRFFSLPVYRKDILKCIRHAHYRTGGLCRSFEDVLANIGSTDTADVIFPLFTYDNAQHFNTTGGKKGYWWSYHNWSEDCGRMQFLDWLIEQYKDDKEDLRKYLKYDLL